MALNALKQFIKKGFHLFITEIEASRTIEEKLRQILQNTLGHKNVSLYPPFSSPRAIIEQAVEEVDLILAKSFIVSGDMEDIQIGREVNCKTIFLRTPSNDNKTISGAAGPHFITENLEKAIDFLDE